MAMRPPSLALKLRICVRFATIFYVERVAVLTIALAVIVFPPTPQNSIDCYVFDSDKPTDVCIDELNDEIGNK